MNSYIIPNTGGDVRFCNILREIAEMHAKKARDYGRGEDVFANIRSSEEWGVQAWKGALVRLGDKVHRIKSFCHNGNLANESVEDSLLDLASYSIITLILLREEKEKAIQ